MVSVACFCVRVSLTIHLICVHIIFSFLTIATCKHLVDHTYSLCILTICNMIDFPI